MELPRLNIPAPEVNFMMQSGIVRDYVSIEIAELNLKSLKDLACNFIDRKCPDHGLTRLPERLILFRHDYSQENMLIPINTVSDITEGTLVEIIVSSKEPSDEVDIRPHCLAVHSYKSPTFCDFCGEMLFGLTRQGLKCDGCGQNFHKRCAYKIPNNCTHTRRRRSSTYLPVTPTRPSHSPDFKDKSGHEVSRAASSIPTFIDDHSALLQTPPTREKRSPSLNMGRPAWVERELAGRIRIPHTFVTHSYAKPTLCMHCKKLLKGFFRQGVQCKDCRFNAHRKCEDKVPMNCPGEAPKGWLPEYQCELDLPTPKVGDGDSDNDLEDSSSQDGRQAAPSVPTPSPQQQQQQQPTTQAQLVVPSHPQEPKPEPVPSTSSASQGACALAAGESSTASSSASFEPVAGPSTSSGAGAASVVVPAASSAESGESQDGQDDAKQGLDESSSNNIPLMRIVQSVKHTKKRGGGAIVKEGWLVHHTNKDALKKRHFWRLDTKSLTLFQNDQSTKYYKEIPLSEVSSLELRKEFNPQQFCFELKTPTCTYFVGEERDKSWETAIRQALLPVTALAPNAPPTKSQAAAGAAAENGQASNVDISLRYQIFPDEVLGSGQFGIVYGGVHRTTQMPVAIKVIDKLRFPTKQEAQLKNEVSILQNIHHPGVVTLERMYETPERIFVVMEKLKGDMLEMILQSAKGRLTERTTRCMIYQILIALKFLHSKNIVHCDLKPENVLLSSDAEIPQVKLCDFGFARIIGEKSFRNSVVGTPAYLAPEVLRNKGYNRSLDMWSVGVIIYVSLSGTFPFNEDEDINDQIQNADFMYPPQPWKEISLDAVDLISNLLQVKTKRRITVDKSLLHSWLRDYQLWVDLIQLEGHVGVRYLTDEAADAFWENYAKENQLALPVRPSCHCRDSSEEASEAESNAQHAPVRQKLSVQAEVSEPTTPTTEQQFNKIKL